MGYEQKRMAGNPLSKKQASKLEFSRNEFEKILHEEIAIYRQREHGSVEASGGL